MTKSHLCSPWPGTIPYIGVAVAVFLGCDGGPQLGQVTGTVLLDDEPLAGAVVIFQPADGGPSSHAETDEAGRYELMFAEGDPGAVLGSHIVTVETKRFHIPDSVERVPAKYNKETILKKEVVAGPQTIDLPLASE